MRDRDRDVGLFRYSLIREAADPSVSKADRGVLVRAVAAREHTDPTGVRVRVGRSTLDRWIREWRAGGFAALVPTKRIVEPTTPAGVLELAVKLKRETPGRTWAQVTAIIAAVDGAAPSERTIQRLFARHGLNTRPDGTPPAAFGRFEAAVANDRWTGDALHGPVVGGHKAYLFAFIDDHSRAIPGYRRGHSEDTVRLEAALRHGLGSRGVPRSVYVDNGSAFVSAPLLRACAVLGIRLIHSRPRTPRRSGQDRTVLPHRARSVPGRNRRPRSVRSDGDEPAVRRLGRDRLSPSGPFRNETDTDRAVLIDTSYTALPSTTSRTRAPAPQIDIQVWIRIERGMFIARSLCGDDSGN